LSKSNVSVQAHNPDEFSKSTPSPTFNLPEDEAVYLTAAKLAIRLSISRQTVYNLMGSVLKEGVHYFRGLNGRPLFKWKAIVELVESTCPSDHTKGSCSSISAIGIPVAENTVRFPTLPKIGNVSES
jgi:hypothetical protein